MAKHTFRSAGECAHAWAHQTAEYGKSSNTSFWGGDFYSYNTCIARRLVWKGKAVFVIDTTNFSLTTNRHQGIVRHAAPLGEDKYCVDMGRYRGLCFPINAPVDLVNMYLKLLNKPQSGCRKHTKASDFLSRIQYLELAYGVAKKYRVKGAAKLGKQLASLNEEKLKAIDTVKEYDQVRFERMDERRRKRIEVARIAKAAAIAEWVATISGDITQLEHTPQIPWFIERAEHKDLCDKVIAEQQRRDALTVDDWLKGEPARLPHIYDILLRVAKDGRIQTSRNAFVPYEEGRKAFEFAMSKRETGWRRNGHTFKIGDFQLDSVGEHGVIAGCHDIKWGEIERFAKQEGWM
jgi:hypothetical protein